jgi:hypothetical protein
MYEISRFSGKSHTSKKEQFHSAEGHVFTNITAQIAT